MKTKLTFLLALISLSLCAQKPVSLQKSDNMEAVNVTFTNATYKGKEALKVMPEEARVEAKFVKLTNINFKDGIIELEVAGMRAKDAGQNARGFVGLAFRVNDDNSAYEHYYIRPTNGRANDQLRRNHSVQYTCFPDFPWHKLRKETPGKYETYADLVEGEWTKLKVVVKGDKAKLFVGGAEQPTLLVNDLKMGANASGAIGLWVGPGTEAYFADLKVTKK
ncbi:MAG: hypothetical protein R3182_15555 [Draconibacterium sp.]|nr:hypothetical protein [Draconibacterium sp.]